MSRSGPWLRDAISSKAINAAGRVELLAVMRDGPNALPQMDLLDCGNQFADFLNGWSHPMGTRFGSSSRRHSARSSPLARGQWSRWVAPKSPARSGNVD
jgi:hypothetical protein